jgi:hypothetical protein
LARILLGFFMISINVSVEIGKKNAFAGAVDWPGWCRGGKDENTALLALLEYGPRYAQVMGRSEIKFQVPTDTSDFVITERHVGNSTTDFGAPAIMLDADQVPIDQMELERLQTLLGVCWIAFDRALQQAADKELRKGPRGGGRELDKIIEHIIEADRGYLSRLAWKHQREPGVLPEEELTLTRQAILNALKIGVKGELPEQGPRGGIIWPPLYFVRRVAWHVLDHTWEIEDRII